MTIFITYHQQHCQVGFVVIGADCKDANDTEETTLNHWIKNLAERKALDNNLQHKADELVQMNEALKKEIQEREYAQVGVYCDCTNRLVPTRISRICK